MSERERLEQLHQHGLISDLDLHFADFIQRLASRAENGADADELEPLTLAAVLASHETSNGNICVNLPALADQPILSSDVSGITWKAPGWPEWRQSLLGKNKTIVGRPREHKPLILDDQGRLYLFRYWDYEQRLSQDLLRRAATVNEMLDENKLVLALKQLFPLGDNNVDDDFIDWQKIAAVTAVLRRFCVISGGPGTGKTTTVLRILALLLDQNSHLRIGLVAPTGKAAARMQEAIRAAKQHLNLPSALQAAIPEQAATIHRLLGPRLHSVYFQHDKENPLALDVLVVDEASMIDLALMTKLIEALPPRAHLILLGDKDQLASVEAGAVLGDICGPEVDESIGFSSRFRRRLKEITGEPLPAVNKNSKEKQQRKKLADSIVLLRHSYRFGVDSGIGALARAVNQGNGKQALEILQEGAFDDISWQSLQSITELQERFAAAIAAGYADYLQALRNQQQTINSEVFTAFNRFQVLCALRNGPYGVDELNRSVEMILRTRRLLRMRDHWYHGRPVMITRNDYNLRLYNGDIGIVLADPEDEQRLKVFFPSTDAEGVLRRLPATRLPDHETCFAMTVHKSQGSEFDHVLLLLPLEQSRILSRELILYGHYTGKASA